MICPYCGQNDDKVIDSRASDGGKVVRRRRQCLKCEKRFTTYERVEEASRLMVVKRDGTHVPFSRDNVLKGIVAACGKRPVAEAEKMRIVDEVEDDLHREYDREVPSKIIGEHVMTKLKEVDDIAYIRFASEHLGFNSAGQIVEEASSLNDRVKDVKDQQKLF